MPLWLSVMFARGGFDAGPFNFAVNSYARNGESASGLVEGSA